MASEPETRTAGAAAAPKWMEPCRQELLRLDPRYLVLFNLRWRQFGGDCTAAQLHRALHRGKYRWAPAHERTVQRWLQAILATEATYMSRFPTSVSL